MTGTMSAPSVLAPGAKGPDEIVVAGRGQAAPAPSRSLAPVPRPLVVAHALTLVAAFGVWAYFDRNLWFFGDEWDFLTRRGLHGATFSIWAPHNEHWSVLPILLWRAVFAVEHLSTYWAYLAPLLLAHVAVVHLLWRRCLREGAHPLVATSLALMFALFGTGAEDLAWAFQIGFVGSLLFGLVALEVAEGHLLAINSPLSRDLSVSLLAVAALMCSDVGVATTVGLAVVLLARNGWVRATRTLAVPVAVYVVWFALAGHEGLSATGDTLKASVFREIPTFVSANLERDLGHASGWPATGFSLVVVLVAWLLWRLFSLARDHPAVLGGVVAAVSFYTLAALGRDRISATMSPSRYAYIGVALLLPALALMLSALPSALQKLRQYLGSHSARAGTAGKAPELADGKAQAGLASALPMGGVARAGLLAAVAVVLAATVANCYSGLQFAESRTVFVGGLKDQIVTTAVLLQNKQQVDRAVDVYPVWASGFASGYLTPWELAQLYDRHLLPRPAPALMTSAQVREDESWLDVSALHRRIFAGSFVLVGRAGLRALDGADGSLQRAAPARAAAGPAINQPSHWISGPGRCAFSGPEGVVTRAGTMTFALARGDQPGALLISMGASGGRVHFHLSRTWGFGGPPGRSAVLGETVQVPAKSDLWVNDSVPGDGLVLALGAGQRAEVCGLAPLSHER